MAHKSLEQIVEFITAWGGAHLCVKKVGVDFESEMGAILTQDERYPALFVALDEGQILDENTNTLTITVFCLDVIQKDRNNIVHILSDTGLILNDLYLEFKDGDSWDFDAELIGNITRVNNSQLDYLAGNKMTLDILVDSYSACEIPVGDFLHPVEPCDPSTVRNSDNTYNVEVASGETLVLPDITVTDSDGTTRTQPSVTPVFCSPNPEIEVDAVILNTNANIVATKTVTPTDNEIEAPDGIVHIKKENDGTISNVPTPSGATTDYIVQNNDITVNGGNDFEIHATESLDVRLRDENNNVVNPVSVTHAGSHATVVLPTNKIDVTINGIIVADDAVSDVALTLVDQNGGQLPFTQTGTELEVTVGGGGLFDLEINVDGVLKQTIPLDSQENNVINVNLYS